MTGPRGGQALGQALHLDVVSLVAVLPQARGIGGHEREAFDRPFQRHGFFRRVQGEVDPAEGFGAVRLVLRVVPKGVGPHAILADPVQVDVAVGDQVALEPLGLGQQVAALEDAVLSVPGQVGGRLPRSRRGVDVG